MDTRHEKFVPANLQDIIIRLEVWAHEQNVLEKATQQCRIDLRRCFAEQWEGWERLEGQDLEAVELQFVKHALMFHHGGWAVPNVTTELLLFFLPRSESAPFGSYRFGVRLDGYVVGGYLIIFPGSPPEPSAV